MSTHIPFTDNYEDLSTDQGFQFKFNCERCGNGYMSTYQRNMTNLAGEAIRSAGGLLGGILGRAANSSFDIQRMIGGPAHDAAIRKAVEEISPLFHQCKRCGQWMCHNVCWNESRGQCVNCAPHMDEEIKAIESEATVYQLRDKAMNSDLTGGVKLQSAAAQVECPSCGSEVPAGKKFCGECGTNVLAKPKCPSCDAEATPGQKFCAECGTRIGA
jgi:DNA-directed RNA polymerase subunit M/transcription elongation factor TFIIS